MHKTVVFMMLLALITTGCDKSAETADSSPSATDGSMAPDTGGDLGVDLSPPDAALPDQGAPDSAPPDQGAPDVTVSCPSTPPAKGSPCKSYPGHDLPVLRLRRPGAHLRLHVRQVGLRTEEVERVVCQIPKAA